MPDAWDVFTMVARAVLLIASFDLGIAFLMRGQREASTESHDYR